MLLGLTRLSLSSGEAGLPGPPGPAGDKGPKGSMGEWQDLRPKIEWFSHIDHVLCL